MHPSLKPSRLPQINHQGVVNFIMTGGASRVIMDRLRADAPMQAIANKHVSHYPVFISKMFYVRNIY